MSEVFDADWLALREGVDHRSRADELTERLAAWVAPQGRVQVVDLGSGTGSNLRYLSPRLTASQSWLLVDHDEELLRRAVRLSSSSDKTQPPPVIETRTLDLADTGVTDFTGTDVVTASALLDLVSSEWIESLAAACATSRCAALFALTFDGTITWGGPPLVDDDLIVDAVNAHQRREKGLGAALGPDAITATVDAFQRRGFRTFTARSPWRLGPADRALASALMDGWVEAAVEQRPDDASRIRAWAVGRRETLTAGDFVLTVGHVDILALPS